ncbi:triosephosphate isomerase [Thiobacillus denitrificans ATCC 25259]|uniref:Triosephosphate isomerase n=1 Tax=Thiobacillus denitrificans (strain ATCC 25259 / T1) TaxID=292415 RepID=TPIS_THIDA|nr:triose-phosphate isomerase [Thiobacillus denitrificans]Q3SJQ7.1 RecName: Full=Triosephosphate isomerase; Short=TIM; Short=TPI; AltName: Full=Triose-phosphate isomerase [Thiobacillus denitrificans ATCC 25259]AAZ97093.1 triosephosphate isomerase [Thiobacillus denitrificans ATCC 25259]
MRKKLVAGNWKMHGSLAENAALLAALKPALQGIEAAVCVPFPYLAQVQTALAGSSLAWGAQNVSEHGKGAFTGEVSASMLLDFGCKYVIVGHSERRSLYGESDALVAAKYMAAQAAGLTPILCVGESLAERESGVTEQVVARQLDAVVAAAGIASLARAVVAYEPVWAIGTGKTASPEQAQAVHAFIRGKLADLDAAVAAGLIIQYGGSVKAANAAELMAQPDIDGGLIGGASLLADEFVAICRAAAK